MIFMIKMIMRKGILNLITLKINHRTLITADQADLHRLTIVLNHD